MEDIMADFVSKQASFKRDYETGKITLPNGNVIEVMRLPEESLRIVAVYGFIRQCQDPCGGIKDPQKKKAAIMEIADELIAGTYSKERVSSAKSPAEKLAGLKEERETLQQRLADYTTMPDEEKRIAAKFGISRSGLEKEIAILHKKISGMVFKK